MSRRSTISSLSLPLLVDSHVWGKLVSLNPETYADILLEGDVWFGRDFSCHSSARYTDGTISKKHCLMYQKETGGEFHPYLRDTSQNGTFIDETLVGKSNEVPLKDGSVITFVVPSLNDKKFTKTTPAYKFYLPINPEVPVSKQLYEEETLDLRKNTEILAGRIEKWAKSIEDYKVIGIDLNVKAQSFLGLIGADCSDKTTQRIVSVLQRLEEMKSELHQRTEKLLIQPMNSFLESEIKAALELEKNVKASKRRYDEVRKKYEDVQGKMKKESEAKLEFKQKKLETKYLKEKEAYELNYSSYVSKLREIEAKKTNNLNNWLIKYMFANLDYLSSGHQYLQLLETEMQTTIQKMSKEVKEQEEKHKNHIDRLKQFQTTGKAQRVLKEKQGYLIKNKKPVWVVVMDGFFSFYKSWREGLPLGQFDLILCSIKSPPELRKRFAFEFVSPMETHVFHSNSAEDLEDWIMALKNGIAHQLETRKNLSMEKTLAMDLTPLAQVQLIPENYICADCTGRHPEWASVNLGCVICYECSGVHRSLGVHISKVRSLVLDKWEPQLLNIIKCMGNAKAQGVFEADVPPKYLKPPGNVSREVREKYIIAKYKNKKFVRNKEAKDVTELSRMLYQAIIREDDSMVENIIRYLAYGAHVNWANPEENHTTALHFAVAAGNLLAVELLIQNGASLTSVDNKGWTPLHYAAFNNQVGCARLLVNRGATVDIKNQANQTPLDMANLCDSRDVLVVLQDNAKDPSG